ncbi:response regulator transcription factor [Pelotomaculum terephthalicicum JT]|uniref:response regulator transcription factor n=1 Tax=Pelotomaculum terephthalicicum TaxID=206393 RepID=UPI001F03F38C|nr:response regulator transcription factor [Pelotomaculum terephthalicicum]MCG9969521.1 response regulator transcription factor [Pelotomaculum terephthalicicum JT]
MQADQAKVLIVEDEISIRKFIAINLHRNNFEVLEAEDGETGLEMAKTFTPDVVILDVMLPSMDGFEVCMQIRRLMPQIVIIMLTAKGEDMDKIMGLDLGADDYMVKPFNPLELIARIRANLRKLPGPPPAKTNCIFFRRLMLDLEGQHFYKSGREIELTPTEFAIMKVFLSNPKKAFSRNEIMNGVWGRNYFGDLKTVDVHIRRIREKLEEDPSAPRWIETVWGVGYRLKGEGSTYKYQE